MQISSLLRWLLVQLRVRLALIPIVRTVCALEGGGEQGSLVFVKFLSIDYYVV